MEPVSALSADSTTTTTSSTSTSTSPIQQGQQQSSWKVSATPLGGRKGDSSSSLLSPSRRLLSSSAGGDQFKNSPTNSTNNSTNTSTNNSPNNSKLNLSSSLELINNINNNNDNNEIVNNQQQQQPLQQLRKCNSNENVTEVENNSNNNSSNNNNNNNNNGGSKPTSPRNIKRMSVPSPRMSAKNQSQSPGGTVIIGGHSPSSPSLSSTTTSNNSSSDKLNDGILVKVWIPMEYTGQLYRVRKFSSGKSTQEIVSILNSQLAPIYQSSKNKLFLNNADRPIPDNISLRNLYLNQFDILYLRREPEYELIAPGYPQKGSLVLDKDVKVGEVLHKIEQWLGPIEGVTSIDGVGVQPTTPLNRSRGEYYSTMFDQNIMSGGAEHTSEHDTPYKLLKKLFLPTKRQIGKSSRGYYLRLYDQKSITNYGIKIKDTLIFKRKAVNRGLCVDDADGGVEITVLYSPLSMLPAYPEVDQEDLSSSSSNSSSSTTITNGNKEITKEKEKEDIFKDLMIKVERLPINDPSMLNGVMIEGDGLKTERRKGKDRRTPSSVGLPYNLVHKTHVDFEYKWTGKNVEEAFEFKEKLGQGGYGAVFKVQHKESGAILAVKVLSITPTRISDIEKEIDLLKKCRCPNVLSYYGSISKLAELWILMDYCAVGSIKDMMKTCCDTLDEEQIAFVADGVLKGLVYLHSKGIVHLDVKAANILLTEDGQLKIADFGVSQQLQTSTGQSNVFIGSPLYMAPELILKAPFSNKADVWSLGITMIELAEGRAPNRGLKSMSQLTEIPNMPPPKLSNPKDWSPTFNDFIAKCLVKDPDQRPSVLELLSHPFVVSSSSSPDCLNNLMKQCLQIRENQNKESDNSLKD